MVEDRMKPPGQDVSFILHWKLLKTTKFDRAPQIFQEFVSTFDIWKQQIVNLISQLKGTLYNNQQCVYSIWEEKKLLP